MVLTNRENGQKKLDSSIDSSMPIIPESIDHVYFSLMQYTQKFHKASIKMDFPLRYHGLDQKERHSLFYYYISKSQMVYEIILINFDVTGR